MAPLAPRRPARVPAVLALSLAAAVATACTLAAARPALAQTGVERIVEYDVEISIERGGVLAITERITYDFAGNERHGILRDVPVRLRYDDRYDRVYDLDVVSVNASEGTPDQYEVSTSGGTARIRIGDPDRTITGVRSYTIVYRVADALNHFDDHDELYWNAVGLEWTVPIGRADVRLDAPADIQRVSCFAGPAGSLLPCAESAADGPVATFGHGALGPGEALTIVVGLPTGAVVPTPAPELEERWSLRRAFEVTPSTVAAAVGLLLLVVAGVARMVWRAGRDRRYVGSPVDVVFGNPGGEERPVELFDDAVTPVEFAPPDGVRPGQVGTLVDERANALDVIATVVDLAVRGYLRIEEVPKQGWFGKPDWKLVELKAPEGLRTYEVLLHQGLFANGEEVRLSSLKNTFVTRLKSVQAALYDDVVTHKWFSARPDHVRDRWTAIGLGAAVAAGGLVYLAARFTHYGLVPIPLVLGGLLLAAGARWMPSRTARGTATLRRVLGFRRFIEESEAERARFAERQHLFSEYLPYAVVFGCTEKWANAFAGIDGELPEVRWYSGSRAFTASSFGDSMDGFAVTGAGTISSTPSGSGSSGFGGGGSSGGGGGGGGGGSW